MMVLTHKGIERYNGKQFVRYPLYKNNKAINFYPNLNILKTDEEKTLWEIGKDGLVIPVQQTKDQFQLMFDLERSFSGDKSTTCYHHVYGQEQQYLVLH